MLKMRFSIIDQSGHTTLELDPRTKEGAALAQAKLDELVADHRVLAVRERALGSDYRVVRPGGGGKVPVGSLDPDSEVLGVPQLKGG